MSLHTALGFVDVHPLGRPARGRGPPHDTQTDLVGGRTGKIFADFSRKKTARCFLWADGFFVILRETNDVGEVLSHV